MLIPMSPVWTRLARLLWPSSFASGALALLWLWLSGFGALPSTAAAPLAPTVTITVNSTADNLTGNNGLCTLREAVRNANTNNNTGFPECAAGGSADIIILPAGIYTLTLPATGENSNAGGDLDATDPTGLTIIGAGAGQTIIKISVVDRVIHAVNGALTLRDLTVQNGIVAGQGGGVNAALTLTLQSVTVQTNTATIGGGGVYVGQSTVISGSTLLNNTSGARGGGLYADGANSPMTWLTNTAFISNTALDEGGGAFLNQPGHTSGGRFERNQTTATNRSGGGLYSFDDQQFAYTQFLSNTAGHSGGGLYVSFLAGVTLTHVGFTNNVALRGYGGGARVATVTVTGGQFTHNRAPDTQTGFGGYGGGLYAGGGALSLSGTTFLSNTAYGRGGGLYIYTNTQNLQNARFISNSAGVGGGFYAEQSVALQNSQFLSNVAYYGGGLYVASITLTQVGLTNNVALSMAGGGAYATVFAMVNRSWFERNRTNNALNGDGAGLAAVRAVVTGSTFLSNTAGSYGGGASVG